MGWRRRKFSLVILDPEGAEPVGQVRVNELHAQAAAIARDTHRTLSEAVALLMRRGLGEGSPVGLAQSAVTGLPVVHLGRVITSEDVRALEDD